MIAILLSIHGSPELKLNTAKLRNSPPVYTPATIGVKGRRTRLQALPLNGRII